MIAVMIDLETLSTRPNAVILTAGMVKFDPYSNVDPYDTYYARLDVDSQIALGRDVSEDTINWWANQDTEVREDALGETDRIPLTEFVANLNRFVTGTDCVFAQGPIFDIVMLENLYW